MLTQRVCGPLQSRSYFLRTHARCSAMSKQQIDNVFVISLEPVLRYRYDAEYAKACVRACVVHNEVFADIWMCRCVSEKARVSVRVARCECTCVYVCE